jgi:hypothetical protein
VKITRQSPTRSRLSPPGPFQRPHIVAERLRPFRQLLDLEDDPLARCAIDPLQRPERITAILDPPRHDGQCSTRCL